MTRMCNVVCTAETENMQASQISKRNHSAHFEWKFLCTLLSITNRLCLASVHTGGQALLLAVSVTEGKSFCHRHLHSVNRRVGITLLDTNFIVTFIKSIV